MSNTIQVICFVESRTDKTNKFYINEQGHKISCSENLIETIWNHWIINAGTYRSDTEDFTIFNFRELITIEI